MKFANQRLNTLEPDRLQLVGRADKQILQATLGIGQAVHQRGELLDIQCLRVGRSFGPLHYQLCPASAALSKLFSIKLAYRTHVAAGHFTQTESVDMPISLASKS